MVWGLTDQTIQLLREYLVERNEIAKSDRSFDKKNDIINEDRKKFLY